MISRNLLLDLQLKEREEDYLAAINLYMKAGLPARAARLAGSREVREICSLVNPQTIEIYNADLVT
jgi:hypothetical protein